MVAKASAAHGRNAQEVIAARLDEMDEYVSAGEWEKVEAVLKRLPQLFAHIPVSERRDAMLKARSRVEQVRERVMQQSQVVGERLATLKTGKQASDSYRATSAMGTSPRV